MKIRNIVKHNNYLNFASNTHQSSTSEQSSIGTELENGKENRKYNNTNKQGTNNIVLYSSQNSYRMFELSRLE